MYEIGYLDGIVYYVKESMIDESKLKNQKDENIQSNTQKTDSTQSDSIEK